MTIDEIAAKLRIPKATIYEWRSGPDPIPAFRLGKHLRFRWSEVEEWIELRRGPVVGRGRSW